MSKKLVECKTCKQEIAKNAKACPHCGAKNKILHPIRGAIGGLVCLLLLLPIYALFLDRPSVPVRDSTTVSDAQEPAPVPSANAPAEDAELLLWEGEHCKVSYLEIFEEASVSGVFYLRLRVENTSDREILVALSDASVNKVSTLAMSGVPMVIQPENSSKTPFIFSYTNLDVTELAQIEDVSFKVTVSDNSTMQQLSESKSVSITPQT